MKFGIFGTIDKRLVIWGHLSISISPLKPLVKLIIMTQQENY